MCSLSDMPAVSQLSVVQSEKLTLPTGPSIEELVAKEDIDILPYVSWHEDQGKKGSELPAMSLVSLCWQRFSSDIRNIVTY